MLASLAPRRLSAFAAALFLAAAARPAAAADRGIEIVDFGVYDHIVTQVIPEPKDVARERTTVSNVRLREKTEVVDAQRGRMFGFQFRVTDPALYGKTLVTRKVVPKLTNPKTGRSATIVEGEITAGPDTVFLNAYGFDYDWERAEGEWTFQVLLDGRVLAEKKFKVILPMN
jgi:hypothetical protein